MIINKIVKSTVSILIFFYLSHAVADNNVATDMTTVSQPIFKLHFSEGKKNIEITSPVYFQTGKIKPSKRQMMEIRLLGQQMKEFPDIVLMASGHADSRGAAFLNEIVASERANTVCNIIVEAGVEPSRCKSHGYGSGSLASEKDFLNRRVVLELMSIDLTENESEDIFIATSQLSEVEIDQF